MNNRFNVTLLHWLTTIIIGSVLSGLFTRKDSSNLHSFGMFDTMLLCILFGGLFSLPVLLVALYAIPKLLKRNQTAARLGIILSAISLGFVVVGFLVAAYSLRGLERALERHGHVLIGFCIGAILSSIIWAKIYKPVTNKLARESDAIDSDLLN